VPRRRRAPPPNHRTLPPIRVQILRPLLSVLRPGAPIILTLKLPGVGRDRGKLVAGLVADLVRGRGRSLQGPNS
jgi:hypothetical protein